MKFTLSLSIAILFLTTPGWSQCLVDYWEMETIGKSNTIKLFLKNDTVLKLKTHISEKEIECLDFFADENFCLVLIKPKNNPYQQQIINAAFKLDGRWIQDYEDRSYFKSSTGLSCTHIYECQVVDAQTLNVEYAITSDFFKSDIYTRTEVKLGKYALHETETGMRSSICKYNNKYEMGELQKRSTRVNYSGLK